MMDFNGFPAEGFTFLTQLEKNNNKGWFEKHRSTYQERILEPALAFVTAMGEKLPEIAPTATADPRVNGSLFRIHRDTRFSKDKRPYKTHVGIRFRDASALDLASCTLVFYAELNPEHVLMGSGVKAMPPELIGAYRAAVDDEKSGGELAHLEEKLTAAGYEVRGEQLKRVPSPYGADHARGGLLRRKGYFLYREIPVSPTVRSARFLDECFECFRELNPLYQWFRSLIQATAAAS